MLISFFFRMINLVNTLVVVTSIRKGGMRVGTAWKNSI